LPASFVGSATFYQPSPTQTSAVPNPIHRLQATVCVMLRGMKLSAPGALYALALWDW